MVQNDARVDTGSDRKADAVGDIRLDKTGHNVGRRTLRSHDHMDTGGATKLRDSDDGGLDVLARNHHEVGELVDNDDQIGHLGWRVVVMVEFAGGLLLVEGSDLTNANTLEDLKATLHLGNRPLQRARGLFGLGHHGHVQVRQTVIGRELDALGIDHD